MTSWWPLDDLISLDLPTNYDLSNSLLMTSRPLDSVQLEVNYVKIREEKTIEFKISLAI